MRQNSFKRIKTVGQILAIASEIETGSLYNPDRTAQDQESPRLAPPDFVMGALICFFDRMGNLSTDLRNFPKNEKPLHPQILLLVKKA